VNISAGPVQGVSIINIEKNEDQRGFFARVFCSDTFRAAGLQDSFPQANVSNNKLRGTFRGLHMQREPHGEVKIVRCTHGAIFDIIVDLRKESSTYLQWFGMELTASSYQAVYIPKGFAHGFQTLTDNAEVYYLMGANFSPGSAMGIRWDDPILNLKLPLPISIISETDQNYPPFQEAK